MQLKKSFQICQSQIVVVQIESRFKISQSLAIEVQSWKSRFKICQSKELVAQIESRF